MPAEWHVRLSTEAENDLDTLDGSVRKRVLQRLGWLEHNFDSITPTPLHGPYKNFFKLRIGEWRVLYTVDWEAQIVFAVAVGHRKDIYRKK